ncbi:MAG TPA: alpha/beta hydrolase-fold protein [Verrucomicrobiae bacterium]|nr:alpha/beta hydrolase-fold protein [Verrucomicrobiae bacterium]
MKTVIVAALLSVLVGAAALAQPGQPPADAKPAPSNVPGGQFPKIDSERRAYFRIRAPEAKNVSVGLPGGRAATEGADGLWTVTTDPLAPGFHYYSITVDGATVSDPASESYFGTGRMSSGIEVPSPGEDFYLPKDVPHGDIRAHYYFARSTGKIRRCFVYTPPGYDTNLTARYPVLYLQHGMGEDARGWPTQGRVGFILDNLIAEGKAEPMLVVMDDGGITPGAMSGPRKDGRPMFWDTFTHVLIEDIIPMIDSTYRSIPDRDHRAMAGLSLGGTQTMEITQAHLDDFAYIGIFSAPFGFPRIPEGFHGLLGDPAAFARQVKVLFISIGTAEGGMTASGRNFHLALEKAGIKHVYYESQGTAHEWQTWRRSLYHFAPLLFQTTQDGNR